MPVSSPKPQHPVFSRRCALEAGAVGLLGLGMNHLWALRAAAAEMENTGHRRDAGATAASPRARSVIYVFLSGGLAQHDSFDLKPEAPDEVRGEFAPIATATPGIRICEHLPMLAARSRRWALCRSLTHPYNEHSQGHMAMLSGRTPMPAGFDPNRPRPADWPAIAAVAGRLVGERQTSASGAPAPLPQPSSQREEGGPRPRNNLPPAVVLPEPLIHNSGRVIPGQFAGEMGSQWDPWFVSASRYNPTSYGAYPEYGFHHRRGAENPDSPFQAPNLTLPEGLSASRLDRRFDLLSHVERQQRALERHAEVAGFDQHRQQAVSLLADPQVQRAFDVVHADDATLDRYGRNSFGWSLLMAYRLVEAGVSLVQVNLGNNETWDTHESAFRNLREFLLPPTDRAVSALLDDLEASGLLDSTLVVMAGEFGRTPRISMISGASAPGRDHWGAVQTVFFAGGGVRGGNVVGASDREGAYPAVDPQTPENMAATIYESLGIPRTAAWHDPQGRPHYVYHGEPICGLR